MVAPNWRGQGIGKTLQTWLEARQREIAAGHTDAIGHSHHVFVQEGETAKVAMLVKAGYHAERYFFAMVRPTLNNILDFALPLGLEIRPVQSDQLRKIWDAHGRKRRWTEFISVGERWRKRGLARALTSRSLHAQAALDLQDSGLGVDGANLDGANRVYKNCGFVVTKRH